MITFSLHAQDEMEYDFDASKYEFDSKEALVKSFYNTLKEDDLDSSEVLKHFLDKGTFMYFMDTIASQKEDPTKMRRKLKMYKKKFNQIENGFYRQAVNMKYLINEDIQDFSNAELTSLEMKPLESGKFEEFLDLREVQLNYQYKGEDYSSEIGYVVKLKNKWFIPLTTLKWGSDKAPGGELLGE